VWTAPARPGTGRIARRVGMAHGTLSYAGRRLHYQVTDNAYAHGPDGPGSPPVWAINIHGFFAGGGMYARESRHLARTLGWRVVNPHLPAFGGSAPFPAHRVTPREYARAITAMMDELGIEHAVLLGHSMGGAFAIAMADEFPERTLGIVYRDGVATSAWRTERGGLPGRLLRPIAGRGADLADMGMAILTDLPELVMGRHAPTVARELWPDARPNLRHLAGCVPVARMLLGLDLHDAVRRVTTDHGIPVLTMWGVLDKITPAVTATEFAGAARCAVVWVVGGHSWMLVEPKIQAGVIATDPRGHDFVEAVLARRRRVHPVRTPA
jgi:pimeloyl-ACP methyl ester carboxylesterase